MRTAIGLILLAGCSALPTHRNEPRSCRERVAFKLSAAYPDPNDLGVALDMVCPEPVTVP